MNKFNDSKVNPRILKDRLSEAATGTFSRGQDSDTPLHNPCGSFAENLLQTIVRKPEHTYDNSTIDRRSFYIVLHNICM